ncbi:16S rRNA (uracil(1498)-N(3))-methyltransferase [candidate division WOR-3 bacterium]|nr:16S rRNA (uracil(1498)-N(3))-methyltransferase [candidate division WOR-3 bacterium]
MELFFCPQKPVRGLIELCGSEAGHIGRVLRHRPGDMIHVTDGQGNEFEVVLDSVTRERVTGRVGKTCLRPREPRRRVGLAQAVLKGDKFARVCEGATELGISQFIPLRTARTVGRLSEARLARLRQVALAAMKSSTGTVLPEIGPAADLRDLADLRRHYDQTVVAYEDEHSTGLGGVLRSEVDSVLVVVGPEGGFEPDEIALLRTTGAGVFTLGPRRLRAETAGVVAVGAVLQLLGEMC